MKREWRKFPPMPFYEVSHDGLVRRVGSLKPLKPWIDNGYERVGLWARGKRRKEYVHGMVCIAFHGPREGRMADHIDGFGRNNHKNNLRWATVRENTVNAGARTGKFKGVSRVPETGRWRARAGMPIGRNFHIGMFDTASQAAMAYDRFALAHMPETTKLNILCEVCGEICLPFYDMCPSWD